jgi:hypothetical protein
VPDGHGKLESDKACEDDTNDCLSATEPALEAFFVAAPEQRANGAHHPRAGGVGGTAAALTGIKLRTGENNGSA